MIELRPCESDANLEEGRRVRIAVTPFARTDSFVDLRRGLTPEKLMPLAYLDGELAGSGVGGRGDTASGFAIPRVLPQQRRKGVGTALLHTLAEHVETLGLPAVGIRAEHDDALAFARSFGFEEVGREIEQVRAVAEDEPWPAAPEGIELVPL